MRALLAAAAVLVLAVGAQADPWADAVVEYTIGTGGGAGEDRMPEVVLGAPVGGGAFQGSTDTLSLGLGGSIVLEFTDNVMVNRPGAENALSWRTRLVKQLPRPCRVLAAQQYRW